MKQALKCDFTWADFKTNSDGMVPVVVQDAENDEVLMLAYMNEEAFETTLRLGKMTYWSRSRNELWTKGLSSGHVQYVKQLLIDCDNDTILAKVEQVGAACHTGNRTCFYRTLAESKLLIQSIKRAPVSQNKICGTGAFLCGSVSLKSHYRRRYFKINRTARMYMITLIFFSFAFPLRIWIAT